MSIVRIKEVLPIVIFIFILKPLLLLLLLICVTDLARNQGLMFLLKVVKTRKLGKMECMKFGAVNIYMVKEKGIIMKTTITTTTNSTRNL